MALRYVTNSSILPQKSIFLFYLRYLSIGACTKSYNNEENLFITEYTNTGQLES